MQRLWQRLTRRRAEESAPADESTPLLPTCYGLAAAPVHEIRGPLLAFNLDESPEEDDPIDDPPRTLPLPRRTVPQPVAALQEREYEPIAGPSGMSGSRVPIAIPGPSSLSDPREPYAIPDLSGSSRSLDPSGPHALPGPSDPSDPCVPYLLPSPPATPARPDVSGLTGPRPPLVSRASAGRASAASMWLRWRLWAVASAVRCCWRVLTWPVRVFTHEEQRAPAVAKMRRFIAWEQWCVKRLTGSRRHRMPWIAWCSAMWGVAMSLVSTLLLVAWYMVKVGSIIADPRGKWALKIILLLLPVYVVVHLAEVMSGVIMYRAYDERPPPIRRTQGDDEQPSERRGGPRRFRCLLVSRRPRLQRISELTENSDENPASTAHTVVPSPESSLNVSESEAEQESQRQSQETQSGRGRQQQQPPQEQSPSPPQTPDEPQPILEPTVQSSGADAESDRDADVESDRESRSRESSDRESPQPPPISKAILRSWLFTASSSYAIYGTGMVATFIEGYWFIGAFLVIAIVAAVLPTLDVIAEFYQIPEQRQLEENPSEISIPSAFSARIAAELTPPPSYGQAMALAKTARHTQVPSQINDRSPLLATN